MSVFDASNKNTPGGGNRVAIVGAGQSGLQVGIGLLQQGFEVTMVTNRTAEEVEKGKVLSSQCMFHNALQNERDLGIDFWDDTCPPVEGIGLIIPNPEQPGEKMIGWAGQLEQKALSVDQRVKMPKWMQHFESLGGELIIHDVDIDYLEKLSTEYDLTIVAAGKGEIVKMFERDAEKSMYDKPMRALALTYVNGMVPYEPFSRVSFNLIPGIGEYFVFPALTTTGPCEIMVFEGVPGGPMDCWNNIDSPEAHLEKSLEILNTYLPWEAERCKNVSLTDDNGVLAGRFAPTVRKPVATLPSGNKILGIADVVLLNDPITGQGSNNASKCSKIYLDEIIKNKGNKYDENWMQATFDKYYDYAKDVALWTNTLLGPPPEHILNLLGAAGQIQSLADMFANNFNEPKNFFPWWLDPKLTEELINQHAGAQV